MQGGDIGPAGWAVLGRIKAVVRLGYNHRYAVMYIRAWCQENPDKSMSSDSSSMCLRLSTPENILV